MMISIAAMLLSAWWRREGEGEGEAVSFLWPRLVSEELVEKCVYGHKLNFEKKNGFVVTRAQRHITEGAFLRVHRWNQLTTTETGSVPPVWPSVPFLAAFQYALQYQSWRTMSAAATEMTAVVRASTTAS